MSIVYDWMDEETITDWEYRREREHIENVRHWEGDDCADEMLSELNSRYVR